MIKWIGQHIWDFVSRFRNDVYLESLTTTTESNVLVVDSDGKVSKSTSVGGDITSITAGTNCSGGGASGDVTINVDDAFLINSGDDATTGTITAGGFTTTGTWTFDEYSSGTVGITTVQDSGTTFNDNDTSLMTAAAIDDRILSYGYSTTTGTVTSVGTTTGLSGTVTSSGNLSLALGDLADMTQSWVTAEDEFIVLDNGTQKRKLSSEIFGSNAFTSTTIGTTTNNLTFDDTTIQLNTGTTWNGSAARTVSAKTATISDGGTGLATADQIHEFVTTQTDAMDADTAGNAATATLASTSTIVDAEAASTTYYPVLVDGLTGAQALEAESELTFVGNTGILTATGFAGNLTGNVTGNTSGSSGSCTGNAATATALATARAFQTNLGSTSSANFDGTAANTHGVTGTLAVGNGGTGQTSVTDFKNVLDDETWSFANNVTLTGFVLDSNTITGVDDSSEFTDDDAHIMTSAAINDRFAQINADTTGQAGTVATIAGLAPNTATTQANQPNITTMTGVFTGSANQLITDDGDGTVTSEANLTFEVDINTPKLTLSSAVTGPNFYLRNEANGAIAPYLYLTNQRGSSAADAVDGDNLGHIVFTGYDDGTPSTQTYAEIFSEIIDSASGGERGRLEFKVAEYDGTRTTGLKLDGQDQDGEVDVTIGAGAASTTTIAGTLTMGSTAFVNNSGVVQVATQGTIDHDSLANFSADEHFTQANIVATGALNSGSITSGFGNIDTGSSTIDTTGAVSTGEITSTSIRHSISGGNDGDYGPGAEIIYGIGTDSVTAGVIYCLKDSSNGWVQVDADFEASTVGLLAVATAVAGSTNSGSGMIIKGCVTLANAYTAGSDDLGKIVYASLTPGEATLTKPTASGDWVRILGYSLNVSDGTNQKMFFNPDSTYIELT